MGKVKKNKSLHKILSLWGLFSTFFLICECLSSSIQIMKFLRLTVTPIPTKTEKYLSDPWYVLTTLK